MEKAMVSRHLARWEVLISARLARYNGAVRESEGRWTAPVTREWNKLIRTTARRFGYVERHG